MGALLTWLTGGATTASSRLALAARKWAAIVLAISLLLLGQASSARNAFGLLPVQRLKARTKDEASEKPSK